MVDTAIGVYAAYFALGMLTTRRGSSPAVAHMQGSECNLNSELPDRCESMQWSRHRCPDIAVELFCSSAQRSPETDDAAAAGAGKINFYSKVTDVSLLLRMCYVLALGLPILLCIFLFRTSWLSPESC